MNDPAPQAHEHGSDGLSEAPTTAGQLRDFARAYTPAAIDTIVAVMCNPRAPFATRLAAAESLLARAWGRPKSGAEGDDGPDFDSVLRAADRIIAARDENPAMPST